MLTYKLLYLFGVLHYVHAEEEGEVDQMTELITLGMRLLVGVLAFILLLLICVGVHFG